VHQKNIFKKEREIDKEKQRERDRQTVAEKKMKEITWRNR
jgi:hypothetical protein